MVASGNVLVLYDCLYDVWASCCNILRYRGRTRTVMQGLAEGGSGGQGGEVCDLVLCDLSWASVSVSEIRPNDGDLL